MSFLSPLPLGCSLSPPRPPSQVPVLLEAMGAGLSSFQRPTRPKSVPGRGRSSGCFCPGIRWLSFRAQTKPSRRASVSFLNHTPPTHHTRQRNKFLHAARRAGCCWLFFFPHWEEGEGIAGLRDWSSLKARARSSRRRCDPMQVGNDVHL